MKYLLVGAVAAGALLGTSVQAAPLLSPSSQEEVRNSAAIQKVDWYGWRHHRYWHHHYWHHHYWHHGWDRW